MHNGSEDLGDAIKVERLDVVSLGNFCVTFCSSGFASSDGQPSQGCIQIAPTVISTFPTFNVTRYNWYETYSDVREIRDARCGILHSHDDVMNPNRSKVIV